MKIVDKFYITVAFIFMLSEVVGGVLRFYFTNTGMSFIVYIPKVLLVMMLILKIGASLISGRLNWISFVGVVLFLYSSLVSIIYVDNLSQLLFGAWSIFPVFYGLLLYSILRPIWASILPYVFAIWLIAILGVFLNQYYLWPWIGYEYEISNQLIAASREWYTTGIMRLPGFSKASFEAAAQILLLGLALLFSNIRLTYRVVIWVASVGAILLTTSKTPLGIWVFISFIIFLHELIPRTRSIIKILPVVFSFTGILLPFSYLLSANELITRIARTDNKWRFSLSFLERVESLWPNTLSMLTENGSLLFGRGIGGIGVAQNYFEKARYSPADNLSLYLIGLFGIFGVLILVCFALGLYSSQLKDQKDKFMFFLAISLLMEGWTVNVLESSYFSIAFGLTFAHVVYSLYMQRKRKALRKRDIIKWQGNQTVQINY